MINQIHPRYVWHVGSVDGEVCYSNKFIDKMSKRGYAHLVVYAKQLTQMDYFFLRQDCRPGDSTSAISFFYKRSDLAVTKDFLSRCGIEKYLGGQDHFQSCTSEYMEQNLRVYDMLTMSKPLPKLPLTPLLTPPLDTAIDEFVGQKF